MKSSLKWMQDYVDVDMTKDPQILADVLTVAGIPVESVERWGDNIKNIFTGKILKITKHPNADHLLICQMDMGDKELVIITGAPNVREGNVVPVAVHGAVLPGGVSIKRSKLRGEVSEGMLCSANELGFDDSLLLPEERNGIWILPDDTPVGVDAIEYLGLHDAVYEYELTPNRADCFSMVGLSREFAVMTDKEARYPEISVDESGESICGKVKVTITADDLCQRFTSRLLTNVKIAKSPLWMQQRLRMSGVRPINNVVDVTNYVMLELGIPMHAYDYDKVAGHHLNARRAEDGEMLKTLDGIDRKLTSDMLVIADDEKACGVAGVMGGFATEVTEQTKSVILEAASFKGSSIRKTGRNLGLRSEASARFERGIDSEGCIATLDRAAQLLQQMGACDVAQGVVDVYPKPQNVTKISFTAKQINAYLGTDIPEATMISILKTLKFTMEQQGETIVATVPSWRGDCLEMADISEEIARIYGYENIQATMPWSDISEGQAGYGHSVQERISQILCECGMNETVTFSFMNAESLKKLLFPANSQLYKAVPILNPITEEFPLMRTTLIPSLMDVLSRNQAVKNQSVTAYEIASVYLPKALPLTELPDEKCRVTGLLYGQRRDGQWPEKAVNYDFYDVKGIVESVLDGLGIKGCELEIGDLAPLHPGKSAQYVKDGKVLAQFGEIHPAVLANYDLSGPVFLFDMDFEAILPFVNLIGDYKKVAKFPAIGRDLAFLAPEETTNEEIMAVIRKNGGDYLEAVTLFDMYQGKQVPAGFKSLAYALTFRSQDGTLTDQDIQGPISSIIKILEETMNCKLR